MNDPRRLLEAGSDMEVELLRSADDDAPTAHARKRTLVSLGLAGSIVGASATLSTATAASTTGLGVLKWIIFGVVSGLVTAGGSHLVLEARQHEEAKPAIVLKGPSRVVERLHERQARLAQLDAATTAPPDRAEPAARPDARPVAPAKASPASEPAPAAATPTTKASATTLAQEVASLDSAREALSTGDSAKAIAELERHDKQFKGGALTPEALVLRMEALLQRGDRAGAAAAANVFLATHPSSPYANRVRSILAQATSGPARTALGGSEPGR